MSYQPQRHKKSKNPVLEEINKIIENSTSNSLELGLRIIVSTNGIVTMPLNHLKNCRRIKVNFTKGDISVALSVLQSSKCNAKMIGHDVIEVKMRF